jgi:hypothetical protein
MSGRQGLTVATLFPLDTVAAGDEANAAALQRRGRQRGIDVHLATVNHPGTLVEAQVYLLGGDGLVGVGDLVAHLRGTDLVERVRTGRALVVAVDAGLAAVCRSWTDQAGRRSEGLGLVAADVRGQRGAASSVVTLPVARLGLPALVGWHAHALMLDRDPGIEPLLQVEPSHPGGSPEPDGVLVPGVVGTGLHGPALALNPELADLVLKRATGLDDRAAAWPALPVPRAALARERRIAELRSASRPRRGLLSRR